MCIVVYSRERKPPSLSSIVFSYYFLFFPIFIIKLCLSTRKVPCEDFFIKEAKPSVALRLVVHEINFFFNSITITITITTTIKIISSAAATYTTLVSVVARELKSNYGLYGKVISIVSVCPCQFTTF